MTTLVTHERPDIRVRLLVRLLWVAMAISRHEGGRGHRIIGCMQQQRGDSGPRRNAMRRRAPCKVVIAVVIPVRAGEHELRDLPHGGSAPHCLQVDGSDEAVRCCFFKCILMHPHIGPECTCHDPVIDGRQPGGGAARETAAGKVQLLLGYGESGWLHALLTRNII